MSTRPLVMLVSLLALPATALAGSPWVEFDVESDGIEVFTIATADVNNDGRLDILAGTQNLNIQIHLSAGDGTFELQDNVITLDNDPMALATGDIDGDGDIDIAYGCRGDGFVGWAANNGDGTFSARIDLWQATAQPTKLVLVDADEDGDLDLAHQTHNSGILTLAMQDGSGSFAAPQTVVDGGVKDFVFANIGEFGSSSPDVLYVTNTGTFARRWNIVTLRWNSAYAWGDGSGSVAALFDVNEDSWMDVTYWSNTGELTTARGTSQGWRLLGSFTGGSGPLLQTGNIYTDTPLDLIEARTDGTYWLHENLDGPSQNTFFPAQQIVGGALQGDGWDTFHTFDADGDCDDDLIRDDRTNGQHMVVSINPIQTGDRDNDGVPECWGDCNDDDPSVGSIYTDADCDGYTTDEDCDDTDANSDHRGIDGDCDGLIGADDCDDTDPNAPTPSEDADCDGSLTADDCDDGDAAINPNAAELCDGIDNDCDGEVDNDDDCMDDDTDAPTDTDDEDTDDSGGCSTTGSTGSMWWWFAAGALLLRRRSSLR